MESVETQEIIFVISEVIDFVGVAIIALGALMGVIFCARDLLRQERAVHAYSRLRTFLGRSLLLGLEFLVAGDIIKTVAIEPTFDSVIVRAFIVLVRTVLSLSIDVEIDGSWPWQAAQQATMAEMAPPGRQMLRATSKRNGNAEGGSRAALSDRLRLLAVSSPS